MADEGYNALLAWFYQSKQTAEYSAQLPTDPPEFSLASISAIISPPEPRLSPAIRSLSNSVLRSTFDLPFPLQSGVLSFSDTANTLPLGKMTAQPTDWATVFATAIPAEIQGGEAARNQGGFTSSSGDNRSGKSRGRKGKLLEAGRILSPLAGVTGYHCDRATCPENGRAFAKREQRDRHVRSLHLHILVSRPHFVLYHCLVELALSGLSVLLLLTSDQQERQPQNA